MHVHTRFQIPWKLECNTDRPEPRQLRNSVRFCVTFLRYGKSVTFPKKKYINLSTRRLGEKSRISSLVLFMDQFYSSFDNL